MAIQYEIAFIQHLVLPDSLTEVIEENLPEDILPTEMLRPVHRFAIDYWHAEGTRGTAPSPEAMRTHFAAALAEHNIDLDIDPEDTLSWATAALQGAYQQRFEQEWIREFATEASEADILEFPGVIDRGIESLMQLQGKFVSSSEYVDARQAMDSAIRRYEQRMEMRLAGEISGMLVGLPVRSHSEGIWTYPGGVNPTMEEVDRHTSGIRDGELAVLAAPPKTGKSYFLAASAYKVWRNGRVPVLFSLENSVEMTVDRIACMANGINPRNWDAGDCTHEEIVRIGSFRDAMLSGEQGFHILQPEPGERTMEYMVRKARMLGGTDLYIDQLSHVEPNPGDDRKDNWKQIGNMLHQLKAMISSGRRMPCMLAHQISRDGQKAAEREGRLEMYHLAESASVERTADWVFGLWQNDLMKQGGIAYLQMLAARRSDLVHWQLGWEPWIGFIECQGDVTRALLRSGDDD